METAVKAAALSAGACVLETVLRDVGRKDAERIAERTGAAMERWAKVERDRIRFKDRWWQALDDGDIETLVREARDALPKDPQTAKDARTQIDYFEKNKERMRYAQFKRQGFFVGSGVIEAACKNLIGKRLKQSGMEWTVRGANAIIALRCTILSGRAEDFWEQRAA